MRDYHFNFIEIGLSIDRRYFNRFFFYLATDVYLLYRTRSLNEFKLIKKVVNNPIIIGGCARSGTTLLLSILSSHPKIHAIPYESGIFNTKQFSSRHVKLITLYNYILKNNLKETNVSICEKSPRNILAIDDIIEFYGDNFKFINIVRDGRDVVTSIHPTQPDRYWVLPKRWVSSLNKGRLYENHPQVLTIRYEDLVLDFNTVLTKICKFVNIEYTQEIKEYYNYSKISNIHEKKLAAPFSDSIGRWKQEKFKDVVHALMADEQAEELLKYYKYL